MSGFTGWPAEAVGFLGELEANNTREWFKANRSRWEELLRAPADALAEDLAHLGRPHLFRPFNDLRFRSGPPIKEHVGLALGMGGGGGYYIELSLDGLLIAAGLHAPAPDQVERLRGAVADERTGKELVSALDRAAAAGLERGEPDLKRIPRGTPADHPRAELLRHRSLTVHRREPVAAWMHTPAAGARIAKTLDAAQPLVEWLRTRVGPSHAPQGQRR